MTDRENVASFIFKNEEGGLRSGWRLLIFLALVTVFTVLAGALTAGLAAVFPGLADLLVQPPGSSQSPEKLALYLGVERCVLLAAVLAGAAVCARWLEGRSLASVGFMLHRGWWRDFGLGLIIGAATLAVAVAISAVAGAVRFDPQTSSASLLLRNFLYLAPALLVAAAYEEALVRGFGFQALLHDLGPVWAIAITSIAFSLLHARNPNMTVLALINVCMAGGWLGVAYLVTRSLWLPTALHFSWNFVMVYVFGLPLSGITEFNQLAWLASEPGPRAWLSGGDFGPEGGLGGTAALLASTLIIYKSHLFAPADEMLGTGRRVRKAADLLFPPGT